MQYDSTNQRWIVTEMQNAGRILSKGKIIAENATFTLPDSVPFSIFLNPKAGTEDITQVISVLLQQDTSIGDLPFNIGCWTEPSIITINITSALLSKYDIYWGAGQAIKIV